MEMCSYGCGQEAKFQLKNGKYCCCLNHSSCPENRNKMKITHLMPNSSVFIKVKCKFCNELFSKTSVKKHERSCFLNPQNLNLCIVCGTPLKKQKSNICNKHPKIKYNSLPKVECKFCKKKTTKANSIIHERSCYLNPKNIKYCLCGNVIKNKTKYCSKECLRKYNSNTHGSYTYRKICFENYDKKCIICGEDKIVSVHHLDFDHRNNNPENLIPLCPTHHCYFHSSYRYLIEERIKEFLNSKNKKQ